MKITDVGAGFKSTQEIAALLAALTSVIESRSPLIPKFVIDEASIAKGQIESKTSLTPLSLELSVCLSRHFLGDSQTDIAFRSRLWSQDGALSTLIASGCFSSLIWASFQKLPEAQQNKMRFKNKVLRVYAQLFNLLNNRLNPRERQEHLANLVSNESSLLSQQLRYDPTLRFKFLQALSGCGLKHFHSIIQLLSLCLPLVEDLEAILSGKQLVSHALQATLKGFIQTDDSLAFALLRNSALCEAKPEFVAKILFNRTGAFLEYKQKVESASWLLLNLIRGILVAILPYSVTKSMKPPLSTKLIDYIESIAADFKPEKLFKAKKSFDANASDASFLNFLHNSVNQRPDNPPTDTLEYSFSVNPGQDYNPPSPILAPSSSSTSSLDETVYPTPPEDPKTRQGSQFK